MSKSGIKTDQTSSQPIQVQRTTETRALVLEGDELVDHAKEMYWPVLGSERLPEEPVFTFRTLDTVDVARALARDRVTALICPGSYIVGYLFSCRTPSYETDC